MIKQERESEIAFFSQLYCIYLFTAPTNCCLANSEHGLALFGGNSIKLTAKELIIVLFLNTIMQNACTKPALVLLTSSIPYKMIGE